MKLYFNLVLVVTVCILTGCIDSKNKHEKKNKLESKQHHKWDYSGESGPEFWAELEAGSDCSGKHQSPINIIDIETKPRNIIEHISEIEYEDKTTIKSITNNGHTIQYNFNGELNVIGFKKNKYKMEQFHFHSPSEHTINGVRYPLEIHLVHHSEETNSYIVLAVLVQQGEPDETFTFLEKYLPVKENETKEINDSYYLGSTISELFGADSLSVYTYEGSLTTPPCTEDVIWIVMKDASTASHSQIELLQKLMPNNNYRNTQPINDRIIYHEVLTD